MHQHLDPQHTPPQRNQMPPFHSAADQTASMTGDAVGGAFASLSMAGQETVGDYFAHIERGLPSSTNAFSSLGREETLRELQAHLLSLVAAHQELGDSESDAIATAIVQFGSARKVRRGLQRVALRGAFRDPAFWQAAFAATAAQIVLNLAGKAVLGFDGEVKAIALVQFYSGGVNVAFTLVWLFHLLIVGYITSCLAPRYAPLAATLFSTYQALGWLAMLAKADFLLPLTPLQLATVAAYFVLLTSAPPALYALTAHLFVRRRVAQR